MLASNKFQLCLTKIIENPEEFDKIENKIQFQLFYYLLVHADVTLLYDEDASISLLNLEKLFFAFLSKHKQKSELRALVWHFLIYGWNYFVRTNEQ